MPDDYVSEASLSRMNRAATEARSRTTAEWIRAHVRRERRYNPPGGSGLRRRQPRSTPKSLAGRYYQLLSGYAAVGSYPHDRTGEADTDRCWWCSSSKRQTRHHLFAGCEAWASQRVRMWRRIRKDCG